MTTTWMKQDYRTTLCAFSRHKHILKDIDTNTGNLGTDTAAATADVDVNVLQSNSHNSIMGKHSAFINFN